MINNFTIVATHDTQRLSVLANIVGTSMFNNVMMCMPMLHDGLQDA